MTAGSWQGLLEENQRLRSALDSLATTSADGVKLHRATLVREAEARIALKKTLDALVALHSAVLCGLDTAEALETAGAVIRSAP